VNKAEATRRTFAARDRGAGAITYGGGTANLVEPARSRWRPRSTEAAAAKPTYTVELRKSPSGFQVELGRGVRGQIAEEIQRVRLDVEAQVRKETWRLGPAPNTNVEAGGFLFANQPPRGDRVTVIRATDGGDTQNGPYRLAMQNPFNRAAADPADIRQTWVGDWHSHPATGDGTPSTGDLQGWARELDRLNRSDYVGVIVTADRRAEFNGWLRPNLHAWVVRRKPGGTAVCEPARLA
jgi:Prokaryotic homologs of the JAB domain